MVWAFISYYQYRDRIFSFGLPVLQGSRSSFAAYVSYSSKKTREQEIEAKDERNIALGNAAKATGFEVFTSLFSIAILILALLGYMNTVSFFTLFAAFFIGQSAFIGRLWYLHKNM